MKPALLDQARKLLRQARAAGIPVEELVELLGMVAIEALGVGVEPIAGGRYRVVAGDLQAIVIPVKGELVATPDRGGTLRERAGGVVIDLAGALWDALGRRRRLLGAA